MAKRSNRLLTKMRFSSARHPLPPYGGKGAVFVTRSLTGAPLVAMPSHSKAPCVPSKGKGITKLTCRSELFFTPEGPKMRFCSTKGKAGSTISVTSPLEATRASRDFCNCVRQTKNAKACAAKVTKNGSLGRHR